VVWEKDVGSLKENCRGLRVLTKVGGGGERRRVNRGGQLHFLSQLSGPVLTAKGGAPERSKWSHQLKRKNSPEKKKVLRELFERGAAKSPGFPGESNRKRARQGVWNIPQHDVLSKRT